jgi:hypothetical protein
MAEKPINKLKTATLPMVQRGRRRELEAFSVGEVGVFARRRRQKRFQENPDAWPLLRLGFVELVIGRLLLGFEDGSSFLRIPIFPFTTEAGRKR